jgi:hypothetical protein
MTAADRSTGRHSALLAGIAVTLGGVAYGLLQLLQTTLPSLHLRSGPQLGIAVTVGLIALAIAQHQAASTRRVERQALEDELDAGLACWRPRTASELTAFDLGAHPTGAAPSEYAERRVDGALHRALATSGVVVLYGPPRAGKSRTAYEAVRVACPRAKLLVPEDADGLATVLARMERLQALVGGPFVLWLDELERFLPGLDLEALDRLIAHDGGMRVVATIGEDALAELLAEGGAQPDAHRARRLLARARALPLPAPSPSEGAAVATAAAGTPSLLASLASGWERVDMPPAPRARRRVRYDRVAVVGLGVFAAACAGLTLLSGFRDGWTEPPPLKDQLARLTDPAACETLSASPADVGQLEQNERRLLAVVARRECLGSDELRLYENHAGELREFTTLRPSDDRHRSTFTCIGGEGRDRCSVKLSGPPLLVGAFGDVRTRESVPFALRMRNDPLRLSSLSPNVPSDDRGRTMDVRPTLLRFRSTDPDTPCDPADCVQATPASAWAVFPSVDGNQAVVVGGYLLRGTPEAPRLLLARARQLVLEPDGVAVGRDCAIFRHGRRIRVEVKLEANVDPNRALARTWRRARSASESGIVC